MCKECPICGEISLESHAGEFEFVPPPNMPGGPIVVHNATWEQCKVCGEKILSLELEHALEEHRYRRLGLLSPEQIKEIRERAGLSQVEMAQFLGVGDKSYARWESGKSLHNKSSDNLIRLFDQNPDLFAQLDAQRCSERESLIRQYIENLESLKGNNKLAMAAHGGDLDSSTGLILRKRLQEIAALRQEEDLERF